VRAPVAYLETDRWLVVPPVLNSPGAGGDNSATAIGAIQTTLLSDPFFSGHTFGADAQAEYAADLNDDATRVGSGDFTHFSNDGQAIQAAAIKAFFDALGW
jgi:hypothetical protein